MSPFRRAFIFACFASAVLAQTAPVPDRSVAKRVVILKIDGLNADLLEDTLKRIDPATRKSQLPWFDYIFRQHGTIFENFYTRGISLSAPSWSMLDTGRHAIIRGNVEYDRYTGHVYDYLNFFPFYIGYARSRQVDMPAVGVLDAAGIPLIIDYFQYSEVYQSFQLFQRGVRWNTLAEVLKKRFSSKAILSVIEGSGGPSLDELWAAQTEREIDANLLRPAVLYFDLYTGDVDHVGHATNQPAALLDSLKRLDTLAGRLWTAIQAGPLAKETLFIAVSDHGMNNVPGVFSQSFSLPDLFNSPQGGAHHVITNRHQLSDYKLAGLDPLTQRVITPSTASFYLAGEAARYPTAWLDLDGNERASVHLRSSDLNKIHILLLELSKADTKPDIRRAATACLIQTIDRHRAAWSELIRSLGEELQALQQAIAAGKPIVNEQPKKASPEEKASGEDRTWRRRAQELSEWEREYDEYTEYLAHLKALLSIDVNPGRPLRRKISDFVPELSLGDNNQVSDLQHYVAGPSSNGLVLDSAGHLDEEQSFRYVNYFSLLAAQRVRNNPQPTLSPHPIDFTVLRLPENSIPGARNVYWVYGDDGSQLLISQNANGDIGLQPVKRLIQQADGEITWMPQDWRAGLPLHLLEDPELQIPSEQLRTSWLCAWHSERDWLEATHKCHYSNGIVGITEQFSPVGPEVPGPSGTAPRLLRLQRRMRQLVEPDFQIFAADHWNFNVRNFNPGGNHGGFFRISTHSVYMMAGAGVPVKTISEPYDSLNFASTVLSMLGKAAPMPERVVTLQ